MLNSKVLEDNDDVTSVERTVSCPSCALDAHEYITQTIRGGQLRYSVGLRCGACGEGSEADGGDLPPDLRGPIVSLTGSWSLVLLGWENRAKLLRGLSELLNVTVRDASSLAVQGVVLSSGTRLEMRLLARKLAGVGARTESRRKPRLEENNRRKQPDRK